MRLVEHTGFHRARIEFMTGEVQAPGLFRVNAALSRFVMWTNERAKGHRFHYRLFKIRIMPAVCQTP
jgi:cobyrinic acid a,c-diamide synthase